MVLFVIINSLLGGCDVLPLDLSQVFGGVHDGVEQINATDEFLFTEFEGYVFSVRGPGQSIHSGGVFVGYLIGL
jgi:hypothetical protein